MARLALALVRAHLKGMNQTAPMHHGTAAEDPLRHLYNPTVLGLSIRAEGDHRLERFDGQATRRSPLCGSTATVELVVKDGRIAEFGHKIRACTLGRASAGVLIRNALGRTPEELRAALAETEAMLKRGGPAPGGAFAELAALEPARDFKSRHGSILVPFQAAVAALDQAAGA